MKALQESFKYKGTPEQMQKVADWLLAQGCRWRDASRKGNCLKYNVDYNFVYYEGLSLSYENSALKSMSAALELAIFGTTDKSLINAKNPWIENYGECPVGPDVEVDVMFTNDVLHRDGNFAKDYWWDDRMNAATITHWRFHRPEDAEYYKQPVTEAPKSRTIPFHKMIEKIVVSPPTKVNAADILTDAAATLKQRGEERDHADGERSMASCVTAFNALSRHKLSEVDGWMFVAILKAARAYGGAFKLDDYLDGAAYFALAGEAAANL